jgi:hypothetical protein
VKGGGIVNFDEAKDTLRDGYLQVGLELIAEHPTELFFRSGRSGREVDFVICEEEISEFAMAEYDRVPYGFVRDTDFTFGEPNDITPYVEIGQASMLFSDFFRFDEACLQLSMQRIRRPFPRWRDEKEPVEMRSVLHRPLTIRVYNLQASTPDAALERSSPIVDGCLFELSYLKNITLTLEEEWPRRRPRVRPFQFGDTFEGSELPLPQAVFNRDVVRFYQRGMSTVDPVNQFLSFYHVLEYYFLAVSDERLYQKLSRRLNDPKFSATPSNLDRMIQDTLDHKRETDETEMLKLVLSKFVDEAELIEFIKAYEEYLDDRMYSRRRSVFGESVEVRLEAGHVIGNLAKRIKIIRNALVHSSDRYERQQRYVPTSRAEDMIRREIPLMKYLAERVVIASAA